MRKARLPNKRRPAPRQAGMRAAKALCPNVSFTTSICIPPDPEFGVTPGGRAEHSESSGVSATAAAGRPILPASPQLHVVSDSSGPQVATLAVTQTITAPTVTERGQDRKPSPSKPAGSSNDGDRKPDKGDKDGKKDD